MLMEKIFKRFVFIVNKWLQIVIHPYVNTLFVIVLKMGRIYILHYTINKFYTSFYTQSYFIHTNLESIQIVIIYFLKWDKRQRAKRQFNSNNIPTINPFWNGKSVVIYDKIQKVIFILDSTVLGSLFYFIVTRETHSWSFLWRHMAIHIHIHSVMDIHYAKYRIPSKYLVHRFNKIT